MTLLLSCRNLKKDFGEINIFKDVSFDVAAGERIGLIGLNGSGKTTLVNIMAGSMEADGGTISWHKKHLNIGYQKQESAYLGGLASEVDIRAQLQASSELGLKKVYEWDDEKLKNLSGGERNKLSLSKIWSSNPDFLILDEPTNHMDYEGVIWLIKELKRYRGTVVIISHDRYFLDQCVNRIIELDNCTINSYKGNYSFYRTEKKRRYEDQLNQYALQEEKKNKIKEEIDNLKAWSAKAHKDAPAKAKASGNKKGGKEFLRTKAKKMDIQIKSRIKRLEKIRIEGVEKPKEEQSIRFRLKTAALKGNRIVEAYDISKGFAGKVLFEKSSFYVLRGEKLGIFGDNGCGKTTLLKLLMGLQEADEGEIFLSDSAKIGYLSQDFEHLDLNNRVYDCFSIASGEERSKLQTLLYNMGFEEKMLSHAIGTLSLGELTRLRIAQLLTEQCDLLILDEPLNHLDLNSRERLEEVLKGYNGTIIMVTHDRYALDNICDKLLVFTENKVKRIEGKLNEYIESKSGSAKEVHRTAKERKLLIDNEISYAIGELSRYTEGTEEYIKMDLRFKELIDKRKELLEQVEKTK